MNYIKTLFFSFLLHFTYLSADIYEGVELFRPYGKIDLEWLPQFLPYNPVILEAGAFNGDETLRAAKLWPQGHIIAFEPNPYAFNKLRRRISDGMIGNVEAQELALNTYNGTAMLNICYGMQGTDSIFGYASSLLPLTREMEIYCKGPRVEVPCVVLDDWCHENGIDHVDMLRLELEGIELQVLQKSPNILKNVKLIYVKTVMHPYRIGMTNYNELKSFLLSSNFVLVSHWYIPGIIGHAIFLSRELFDAYFKLSLGIYLGV